MKEREGGVSSIWVEERWNSKIGNIKVPRTGQSLKTKTVIYARRVLLIVDAQVA
jgi:hypothetical protein